MSNSFQYFGGIKIPGHGIVWRLSYNYLGQNLTQDFLDAKLRFALHQPVPSN